jgi:hypothetical protein
MQFHEIIFRRTYLKEHKVSVTPLAEYDSNRGAWIERGKEKVSD